MAQAPVPNQPPARRKTPTSKRAAKKRGGCLKWLGIATLVVVLALAGLGFYLYTQITGSLAVLDGQMALEGLAKPVRVERDALGIPSIYAENQEDLAQALGFLHAQERFFQMDLLRRASAGELSEVLGPATIASDKAMRHHGLRRVAESSWARSEPDLKRIVEAYAEGVNQGLQALDALPFEYLLLQSDPRPWQPVDTVLVTLSMAVDLQDDEGNREAALGLIRETLPEALYEFLLAPGTRWDAPLIGEAMTAPPIPGPDIFTLRELPPASESNPTEEENTHADPPKGSNNWAVSGALTSHGSAMVAGDMHLTFRVPNIWYRADFHWQADSPGSEARRATGVSLPGTPGMVVGSNGYVAWAFTNSYGDFCDVINLEPGPGGTYLTADGPKPFTRREEFLDVKGGIPLNFTVRETIWGPVFRDDYHGRAQAVRWIGHYPEAFNFNIQRLLEARDAQSAMDIANRCGIPAQNFVVADTAGNTGWTIAGTIPKRVGFDGELPTSWADGTHDWEGWLEPENYPRVYNPESGRIWTANTRVVGEEGLSFLGDGGYIFGARAHQIKTRLFEKERFDEADFLAIQMDEEALFLQEWRRLLLEVLTDEAVAGRPERAQLRDIAREWDGHASVDSAGYRLVKTFRSFFLEDFLETVMAPCLEKEPNLNTRWLRQVESPLQALIEAEPDHFLPPDQPSWDAWILASVDRMLGFYGGIAPLPELSWGRKNLLLMQHPFSAAMPFLSGWLDMPAEPLPGDYDMPRVLAGDFGSSQRMVVAPGQEESGIFHMPGGQSGHPLSPFYRAGHQAWVKGEPTPFLPGPAQYELLLNPVP